MRIDYKYQINKAIQNNLIRIETTKKIIEFLPQLPHIEEKLRHKSLLKSSLFSARIEGNRLQLNELGEGPEESKDYEKNEVFNIIQSLRWIYSKSVPKQVTLELIIELHKMAMKNISTEAGRLRTVPSAIFNQAGVAVYMPPPPSMISKLLVELIKLTETNKKHAVIKAAYAHFAFEKIHPFLDGNGRVGRLLSTYILKNSGYDFRGLAVLEEYLNEHRDEYYDVLAISKKDITGFIEFFTEAVAVSAEKVIELLKNQKKEKAEDLLLPRRAEILAIIREQEMVSFDFIKRRFLKVPESSLHYDLKMLLKKGFIRKLGSTRGVLYSSK